MQILNTTLLSHPVNWIKIGLMSSTFLLALLLLIQVSQPAIPANLKGN